MISDKAYRQIQAKFPNSSKTYRLRAIHEEAIGHPDVAKKIYKHLLSEN